MLSIGREVLWQKIIYKPLKQTSYPSCEFNPGFAEYWSFFFLICNVERKKTMPTLQKENPPRICKYATDIMDIKKTVSSTFSYLELTLDIHHMNLLIH